MLRLTGTDRAVAEIAAIAEHVSSLTGATAALRLRPDLSLPTEAANDATLVPLLDERTAGDAASTLAEIRHWSRQALGLDSVPAVWRALAHHPRLLETTWRKDRLVLSAGTLDEFVKNCAALAVAQFRQSDYWIAYFTELLRRGGKLNDRALIELVGAVMHYVSFNTIAHGMLLDAPVAEITATDVVSGGHLEHIVPGVRRRVDAPR